MCVRILFLLCSVGAKAFRLTIKISWGRLSDIRMEGSIIQSSRKERVSISLIAESAFTLIDLLFPKKLFRLSNKENLTKYLQNILSLI